MARSTEGAAPRRMSRIDLLLERSEEAARVIDPALLNTPQFSDPTLTEALGRGVVVKLPVRR